jgi:hypothetical protein
MINNDIKQNCIDSLSGSLKRTANWRRSLQQKYPSDFRNGRSAEALQRLAGETNNLSDRVWSELEPFYNWSSPTWSEAVSAAARKVGFHNVNTLSAFTETLVGILSEQNTAN